MYLGPVYAARLARVLGEVSLVNRRA